MGSDLRRRFDSRATAHGNSEFGNDAVEQGAAELEWTLVFVGVDTFAW